MKRKSFLKVINFIGWLLEELWIRTPPKLDSNLDPTLKKHPGSVSGIRLVRKAFPSVVSNRIQILIHTFLPVYFIFSSRIHLMAGVRIPPKIDAESGYLHTM